MPTRSQTVAAWVTDLAWEQIPKQVVASTKLRILDIVGAMLAGRDTALVNSVRASSVEARSDNGVAMVGLGECVPPATAALIQGTMGCVLEFDDSHVSTGVHASTPVVAAALAAGAKSHAAGRRLIEAVLVGNEIACRLGLVAPGVFHHNGFHPTAMVAGFGSCYSVARIFGTSVAEIVNATGICGSMAAGVMSSWEDGTAAKSLHAGLAARSAIEAIELASNGVSGPASIYEGRFGFFRAHVQVDRDALDFDAITRDLGERWEVLNIASRAFPCGHYIQVFVDAALQLVQREAIKVDDIEAITCPIPAYMAPLICEPREEKLNPKSAWHARYSLQHCIAEALTTGDLDKNSFKPADVTSGRFRALASKIHGFAEHSDGDRSRWSGEVRLKMNGGRELRHRIEHLRGTPQNPMSEDDIVRKFVSNAAGVLTPDAIDRAVASVLALERCDDTCAILRSI